MIQILITKLNKFEKKRFMIQFYISVFSILVIFFCVILYKINITKQEALSKAQIQSYEISRLYSNYQKKENNLNDSDVIGTITIPSIDISYTFFSGINDELLKISPCRFSR